MEKISGGQNRDVVLEHLNGSQQEKVHRKKRFVSFPSPAGMSLPNTPWAGIMTS
jgi:hypothetical protein